MRLKKLVLDGFKGMNYELDLDGRNAKIYGTNKAGKSTLVDAFTWLLFGKNRLGDTRFGIRPKDEDGNPIHRQEPTVEAELEEDGETITLKKTYREKWQKVQGKTDERITGMETIRWYNGIDVKASVYDEKISDLIDEDVFKLITSPTWFHDQLHKKERREILFDVCGTVTMEDVIDVHEELADVPEIVGDESVQDCKDRLESEQRKVDSKLSSMSDRMEEAASGKISGINKTREEVGQEIQDLKEELSSLQEKKARVKEGGLADIREDLAEVKGEISDLRSEHQSGQDETASRLREEIDRLKSDRSDLEITLNQTNRKIKDHNSRIESLEEQAQELRDMFYDVRDREFEFDGDEICPTCGQELPEDQVQQARKKAEQAFNEDKSNRLAEIKKEGKDISEEKDRLRDEVDAMMEDREALEEGLEEKNEEIQEAKAELESLSDVTPFEETEEAQELISRKEELEDALESHSESLDERVAEIDQEIQEVDKKISEANSTLSSIDKNESIDARVQELKEKSKDLSREYEDLENKIQLLEDYTWTKIRMEERSLNDQFSVANFKLYEEQGNGKMKKECVATQDGIPYDDGLNDASRIVVGLDIIRTISDAYGTKAPIFIDNAESIVDVPEMDAQVIQLIVSPEDETLRVETN